MKSHTSHNKRISTYWVTYMILICCYIALVVFFRTAGTLKLYQTDDVSALSQKDIGHFTECTLNQLIYTGIDYLRDGAVVGGYYYYDMHTPSGTEQKPEYMLVLVSGNQPQDVLTQYTARFRILKTSCAEEVLNQLASNTGIPNSEIDQLFGSALLLSEPDYPANVIHLIRIVTYGIAVLLLGMFIRLFQMTGQATKKLP